jgi:hypothetical protein
MKFGPFRHMTPPFLNHGNTEGTEFTERPSILFLIIYFRAFCEFRVSVIKNIA